MDQSGGPARNDVQDEPVAPGPQSTPKPAPAPAPAPAPKRTLTWREARRRRRKARHRGEEILAWVLVPVIVIGLWWAGSALFDVFGTSPGQVWDQLQQVKAALEKKAESK